MLEIDTEVDQSDFCALKIGNVNDTIFEENNVILENIEDKEGVIELTPENSVPGLLTSQKKGCSSD